MTRLVNIGPAQPRQKRIARPRKEEYNDVVGNT